MTRDEKQVLKSLLALAAFKAVLFVVIYQASKVSRKTIEKYTTESA